MKRILRLLALIAKELRTFARDPALLFVAVFLFVIHPYMSATQYSFAVSDFPIAVYDLDRTPQSAQFIEKLRSPYFNLSRIIERDRDVAPLLDRGEVSMAVVIPEGFGRRVHQGGETSIQVLGDGTFSTTAELASAYVRAIAHEYAASQAHEPPQDAAPPVVDARFRMRYNQALVAEWPQSLDMLFMAVTLMAMLLPAAFFVREKEQGTVEQLLVSPLRPWEITASKVFPMTVLVPMLTAAGIGVLVWAFGLPVRGSLLLFLGATALTVFSMSGIGLVVASFTRTLPSTMIVVILLILPIQFLSGGWTPVEAMPAWQYYVTLLNPQRYYLDIGYGVLLKGASLPTLWKDFAGLALVGVGLFALGVRRFQRQFG